MNLSKGISFRSKNRPQKSKKQISVSEKSWGVLHIYLPEEDAFESVCQAVAETYENHGMVSVDLSEVDCSEFSIDLSGDGSASGKVFLNSASRLEQDEVLVLAESAPGWIAVASRRWELTPPAQNPLALDLSKKYTVFGIAYLYYQYVEYTLYQEGKAQAMTLLGDKLPNAVPTLSSFDWSSVSHRGRDLSEKDLNTVFYDPIRLTELMGVDVLGFRSSLVSAAEHDDHLAHFLIFRYPDSSKTEEEILDPHAMYESAVSAYQREEYQQAIETLEQVIQTEHDLRVHAIDLREMILEKIEEKERRGQLLQNPEEGSPIELYNAALSLIKDSEPNRETLTKALNLLEKSSQGGLIQANKLAGMIRKKLNG